MRPRPDHVFVVSVIALLLAGALLLLGRPATDLLLIALYLLGAAAYWQDRAGAGPLGRAD